MSDNSQEPLEQTKKEILKAINRGLNVTANAPHIRDLAAAFALLDGKMSPQLERPFPKVPTTPVSK